MIGHGEKLSRKQEQAIAALLAYPTIPEAAKSIGIGEATLWRWLQQPEFDERYRAARQQVFEGAVSELQAGTSRAVQTLRAVLTASEARASEKVSAARAILEYSLKAREALEIETRLRALEAAHTEYLQASGVKGMVR